jgi:hypothetical protein
MLWDMKPPLLVRHLTADERAARDFHSSTHRRLFPAHPNARFQARLKARARDERTLEGVGCTPLILMEAPTSAYPRGMLALGKPPKERRRPQALLYHATPVVLWY